MPRDRRQHVPRDAQFGLLSLLGFVTVCAILSALSAVVGTASSVLLMLMALALWARQGLLALRMFMAACLGADGRFAGGEGAAVARQLLVVLLAAALCGWYCLRRLWMTE